MKFYYCPGSCRVSKGQRFGIVGQFRLWKRRRKADDFANVKGW